MSAALWAAGLVAFTLGLLILPLLPSVLELHLRRDVAPLNVSAGYHGDIRFFARGFRTYVQQQFATLPPVPQEAEGTEQTFPDGTRFVLLRRTEPSSRTLRDWRSRPLGEVLILETPLSLPEGLVVTAEIYATQPFDAGSGTTLRGLLGEADVQLGEACVVLRWIHGEADVRVGSHSTLYGRASAEGMLRLGDGCTFGRVQAGRIEFGTKPQPPAPFSQPVGGFAFEGLAHSSLSERCWLFQGDALVPEGACVDVDLIARGEVRVERRSHVRCSIKAKSDLHIVGESRLDGALISGRSIHVGEGCRIRGPVIAERDVHLAAGTVVGAMDRLTTISADRVLVEPGVLVFGTVWPRQAGTVASSPM